MTKQRFLNPYEGIEKSGYGPDGGCRRISASVPAPSYDNIRLMRFSRSGTGTINTTINLLWSKLVHELERRNIKDRTDADTFEQFVLNCVLADPSELSEESRIRRGPPSGPLPPSDGGNDGGTVTSLRSGPADPSVQQSDLQGQTGRKQKGGVRKA